MSQNGREKDISLTWKIRRLCSNYVCVCEFVYVCLCVCERWVEKNAKRVRNKKYERIRMNERENQIDLQT